MLMGPILHGRRSARDGAITRGSGPGGGVAPAWGRDPVRPGRRIRSGSGFWRSRAGRLLAGRFRVERQQQVATVKPYSRNRGRPMTARMGTATLGPAERLLALSQMGSRELDVVVVGGGVVGAGVALDA